MNVREKLVELLEPHVSGLACEYESGSCELTSCRSCNARNLADHLIARGVTVQEWISVNDRLPEDDLPKGTKKKMIRCLVYTNKGTIKPCVRQRWEVNGKLVPWQWNKDLFAKPTHWMYYPHPPKGE